MTAAELLVERTTRASGVPITVQDPSTLARLAAMFDRGEPKPQVKRKAAA